MDKKFFFPNQEHIDGTFGTELPCCLDLPEVERLCMEWGKEVPGGYKEIHEHFHEATQEEIDEYGYYDSTTGTTVRGNYERDCDNCIHQDDCQNEWYENRNERGYCEHHEYQG